MKNFIIKYNPGCFLLLFVFVSAVLPAQDLQNLQIGIVHSDLTNNLLYKNDNNFLPIQDWELFFLNKKQSYNVFTDEELDDYDFENMDLLILPSVEVLSDDAIKNLKQFLSDGKGLFILGSIGLYDQNKVKRRMDILYDLTGIRSEPLTTNGEIAQSFQLFNNNILHNGLPYNFSFVVLNNFYTQTSFDGDFKIKSCGKYILKDKTQSAGSGIVTAINNSGRIIWFGFQFSQISVDDEDSFTQLIFNSILWAANKPIAWINEYPQNFSSAVLINNYISDLSKIDYQTDLSFVNSGKIKFNSFFTKPELDSFPDLAGLFTQSGSINFLCENIPGEKIVLQNTADILKGESNQKYFGIKSKVYNNYDSLLTLITAGGFNYLLADTKLFFKKNDRGDNLTLYAKINPIKLSAEQILKLSDDDIYSWLKENLLIENRSGNVSTLNFIDQSSAYGSLHKTKYMRKIIKLLNSEFIWVPTYSELLDWRINFPNLSVITEMLKDEEQVVITVNNYGNKVFENVSVNFVLPENIKTVQLYNLFYDYTYDALTKQGTVYIPFVRKNQPISIEIDYEN